MSSKKSSEVKEKDASVFEIELRFSCAFAGSCSDQAYFVKENVSRGAWMCWFCRGSKQE